MWFYFSGFSVASTDLVYLLLVTHWEAGTDVMGVLVILTPLVDAQNICQYSHHGGFWVAVMLAQAFSCLLLVPDIV